ncbi:MAG: RdgB/HAM1 family non-canonical purine NTP pyrophosphatase [Acidobacteria bacterium]|nr:RdgB/HAM1 family non-canonical purine NTP pyrophosphatase [Acidobacteriaceae bacterium]MBV9609365.1 RdgB/HAM1 family non-canonical purine NTP pyrophosphatase [Acidobacteriota bacterium]
MTNRILLATSNSGKLRDFAAAARQRQIDLVTFPGFAGVTPVAEDGTTFEENARKKAEYYSRHAPGEIVLADDSGLELDALEGAPGVRSARFASTGEHGNSSDAANNIRLLHELARVPEGERSARFVCVIAAAQDGKLLGTFRGEAEGKILRAPRGSGGFGYDPLFLYPKLGKTFAELSPEEKVAVSHRGAAFRQFLDWFTARQRPLSA